MKPHYPLIYNYDSGPIFFQDEPVTPEHVDQMVDEVADAGVDALLVCVNAQTTYFPSRTTQTLWDGFTQGDQSFFVDVPQGRIETRAHFIKQAKRLAEQCDYLERSLARCRARVCRAPPRAISPRHASPQSSPEDGSPRTAPPPPGDPRRTSAKRPRDPARRWAASPRSGNAV